MLVYMPVFIVAALYYLVIYNRHLLYVAYTADVLSNTRQQYGFPTPTVLETAVYMYYL
jgi:hypothetical protein